MACRPGRHFPVAHLLCLAALLVALGGCSPEALATPEPTTLTIAGSTEMRPVLQELSSEFSRRHPSVLFSLRGGGSTLAEQWVREGRIDLAASTAVYPDEALPPGLERIPLGLDGIAVIVHPQNPLDGLTLLQLRGLFSGRTLDWQELGGAPGEVLLVSREDGSATRDLFEERVMGDEGVALTAVVMPTSRDVVAYVADHPQAIGYVSRGHVAPASGETPGANGARVRLLALEGRLPEPAAIAALQYHLSRPLYLVRRVEAGETSQDFIDFVLSPAGQTIVDRYHVRIR